MTVGHSASADAGCRFCWAYCREDQVCTARIFYIRDEAGQAIARYIDGFYNPVRHHSALDYTSLAQFERTASRRENASPLFRGRSTVVTPYLEAKWSSR